MSSSTPSNSSPPTPLQRKVAFRPFKATSPSASRKSDELALLIMAAEAATAAGEFAPFPYIKGACGTFVTLLKAVENVRRNREDLKQLCERIKAIIDILQAQVSANGATIAVRLKDMLVAVARMQAETKGFRGQVKGFIKSNSVSAEIAGYEKRIQELTSTINLITGIDTNFRTIRMESTLDATLHGTNNCPPATRIFQGRENILSKMQEYFAQDLGKQHIYVLYGLGGAGKTQISLKFIQDSSQTLQHFKMLELSDDALKWLVAKHEDWLVFIDNADDPKLDLHKFPPRCNHGNIIITSRNPELRIYESNSTVSNMEKDDAVALLLKSGAVQEMTHHNKETAVVILKFLLPVLWYLPLAIVQAGAFIAKSGALNQYLDLYTKSHDKLLQQRPSQSHSDYERTVYTTWKMSFDRLSPPAAIFLQFCSFIHREGISEEIFSRAADYNFPSFGPSQEELQPSLEFLSQFQGPNGQWDTIAFLEVTTEITSYSLATFAPETKTFSIHPLVHQWSRDILRNPEAVYFILHSIIGMSIEGIPEIHSRLASLALLPHLDAVMQFKKFGGPDFREHYGLLYSWAVRHHEAKTLRTSALEKQRTLRGDNHVDTLYLMHSLAVTYFLLGQLREAEELQMVALKKQTMVLEGWGEGCDDWGAVPTKTQGSRVQFSGSLSSSSNIDFHVCRTRETLMAFCLPNLAWFVRPWSFWQTYTTALDNSEEQKNWEFWQWRSIELFWSATEAKNLAVVVLEKRKKTLGENHPDTLDAMWTLATTYKDSQPQMAKDLVVVLEKRKKILGEDHPDTLYAMWTLATTYKDSQPQMAKDLVVSRKAEELEVMVLEKRKKISGEDHPRTLDAMYNLAITYKILGYPQRAEELELVMVEKRRAILGADHLHTLSAMQNLAVTYFKLSCFVEAAKVHPRGKHY
ncbi:hypothetical protein B0H16DRAFT_1834326 [Mycena metata]|uniref:NB-ARC domain-containing protein n=1 Tax=Mycena metata TaxID=1033252 RepID=A0AAD7DX74_9AGAR|nr:hypothetical protein B0H16DRAFT_1834326 [Mycena metata]